MKWLFRIGVVAIAVIAVAAAITFFSRGMEHRRTLPKAEACAIVSNMMDVVTQVFAVDGDAVRIDARKMTALEFFNRIKDMDGKAVLWTVGEFDWVVTGTLGGRIAAIDEAMDRFAEVDTPYTLSEAMANYVGTLNEVRPAFAQLKPETEIVPELFVTKEVPKPEFLAKGEVDADILERVRRDFEKVQTARRTMLGGNELSRKGDETGAITKWREVAETCGNDTLLLERLEHLKRNAEVFLKIGKNGMAAKCCETRVMIRPTDPVAVRDLGICLQRLGKAKLAAEVMAKAKELEKTKRKGMKR